jgi:hypothetical protein
LALAGCLRAQHAQQGLQLATLLALPVFGISKVADLKLSVYHYRYSIDFPVTELTFIVYRALYFRYLDYRFIIIGQSDNDNDTDN